MVRYRIDCGRQKSSPERARSLEGCTTHPKSHRHDDSGLPVCATTPNTIEADKVVQAEAGHYKIIGLLIFYRERAPDKTAMKIIHVRRQHHMPCICAPG